MGHKGDRKKIVRYWQQLSEVERSMREHESVQEERESNAKGGRVECWKCVPIVQKNSTTSHMPKKQKINSCVFIETQAT